MPNTSVRTPHLTRRTAIPFYPPVKIKADGAFEGGGAKGFCFLGALDALSRAGIWFKRVSGCSAGSITAALVAAGYRVDANYRIDLSEPSLAARMVSPPPRLTPSPHNSLNRIIFEDSYERMYDLARTISTREISASWTKRLFDRVVPANAVLAPLRGLRELVDRLPRGFRNDAERIRARNSIRKWLKNSSNVPPLGLEHNLAEAVADAIVNTARWVVNPVADAMRDSVLDLLDFIPSDVSQRLLVELYTTRASDPDPVRFAKAVFREGFTIVERGGILAGDYFREWLEGHLQARYRADHPRSRGGSADGHIAFKDLPMDLCVAAYCLDCNEMIYFSRKTTPNYSVSEAVRRSMSLPVIFVPRRLNEGYSGRVPRSLKRHATHLIIDGGIRVDLPAWVFRDRKGAYMDLRENDLLVCCKLDELKGMPEKSAAGIPVAEDIKAPRFDPRDLLGTVIPPDSGVNPEDLLPPGVRIMTRMVAPTIEALSSREEEIKSYILTWKKTAIVDIGVKDMAGADPRPMMFNISRKGKKWMAKSGWDAAMECLKGLEQGIRGRLAIPPDDVDPYGPER